MFREMRRKAQQTSTEECIEILKRGKTGILGVSGDDGYPYTVPVNFAYQEAEDGGLGTIHIHCAVTGHKIDGIKRNEKVSFCVIDRDEVMPEERSTKYLSVIAFGKARFLTDPEEMRASANSIGAKYSGDYKELYEAETEDYLKCGGLCCIVITIDHMTGKMGRMLMKERRQ